MRNTVGMVVALVTVMFGSTATAGTDKTLVSWVTLADTAQQGGSALTIQRGLEFDGIVFGEKAPGKWMAGSNFFARTERDQGAAAEQADAKTVIQMAIVYQGDRISIYRNGEPYASYQANNVDLLSAGDAMAVIGLRHHGASSGQTLRGSIEDARIYDKALGAEEIKQLESKKESAIRPYAWWTFEKGQETDRMGKFPFNNLSGGARIEGGRLVLATEGAALTATKQPFDAATIADDGAGGVPLSPENSSITYEPVSGPGNGKHIVFVCGEWEYRCEESLPMIAKILARRHGFKTTVLFSMNSRDGTVDPSVKNNIPGMSLLKDADMMVVFAMDLTLRDEQMKHFVDFLETGKPVFGIRCTLLSFRYGAGTPYARFDVGNGAYARELYGESWRGHYGDHGKESTRGAPAEKNLSHPILRGVHDVWGPTDVYRINNLPDDATVLMYGHVLTGMKPDDPPNTQKTPMPMVWTREIPRTMGSPSRVVVSTIGAAQDMESEDLRRLYVNGVYWAVGLESRIPEKADVTYVGEDWKASPFGGGKFRRGLKPADFAVKNETPK
jgi:type 1 glutamine amidotransferase